MTGAERPTAAILAGGISRRMGRDKATIGIAGMTLLERTARVAAEAGLAVLVVGRPRPSGWSLPVTDFLPDERPGEGPLMGLATALARHAPILALPCDLPHLDVDACRWLLAAATAEPGADAVLAGLPSGPEPLFACYRAACLPAARALLASGRRSVRAMTAQVRAVVAAVPPHLAPRLADADTPDDLRRLGIPGQIAENPPV